MPPNTAGAIEGGHTSFTEDQIWTLQTKMLASIH